MPPGMYEAHEITDLTGVLSILHTLCIRPCTLFSHKSIKVINIIADIRLWLTLSHFLKPRRRLYTLLTPWLRIWRDVLVMESVFQCAYMTRRSRHGKCIPVCVYDETFSSWKVYSSVCIWRDVLVMESVFQCAHMTRRSRHGKCIPVCVYIWRDSLVMAS